MTDDRQAMIDRLAAEDADLVLDAFDTDTAWALGSALRDEARAAGHPVAISITRPSGTVLFHTSLPGATADNDSWARKKAAVVFRFEVSSALVAARLGDVDMRRYGWLDPESYAVTGGAVPIRVRGAGVVAALAISGLASDDDHALAVGAVRRFAGARP